MINETVWITINTNNISEDKKSDLVNSVKFMSEEFNSIKYLPNIFDVKISKDRLEEFESLNIPYKIPGSLVQM